MTEPVTFLGTLHSLADAVRSIWRNGALVLWTFAASAVVAIVILRIDERYNAVAFQLSGDYDAYLLLGSAVVAVFALFKTYAERRARPLILIANEQGSHWGQAKQQSGEIFTTIGLDFQGTNVSDNAVQLAQLRLCWPLVSRRRIVQTMLIVEHPNERVFGHYPIPAHGLSRCSAHVTIQGIVGRPGEARRVVVKIQDHARRWYWLTFAHVRDPSAKR